MHQAVVNTILFWLMLPTGILIRLNKKPKQDSEQLFSYFIENVSRNLTG